MRAKSASVFRAARQQVKGEQKVLPGMKSKRIAGLLTIAFLIVTMVAPPALAQSAPTTPGLPKDIPSWSTGVAQRGLVAVSQPNAARAGAEMLARGGNAFDAAAAIQFALNVEEPMFSGIGGGGFTLFYSAQTGQVYALDSREREPAKGKPDVFIGPDGKPLAFADAVANGLSVGVPGTLMGAATLVDRFGTMKLSDVMQPAITLADRGFIVDKNFAATLADNKDKLAKGPGQAYTMFRADGTPLQAGDTLVQKDLANTFRMIADKGIDAYYHGPIGQAVVDIVKARGGLMEMNDLQTMEVKWRNPVKGSYRGFDIVSMPLPSSGALTMIQMLMMLEKFDIKSMGQNSSDTLQTMIEAMHLAYADRGKYMGDTDFVEVPQRGLLNPAYVATRSAMIDKSKANPNVTAGDPWAYENAAPVNVPGGPSGREGTETTHFVVSDKFGNVVAWTTTIEQTWGSGIMVPGYGFMLNNEMTDFDFTPGGANQVQAMKKPRSSMVPTLLMKDGKPWMATGSPGGATIITTTMQVIMNVLDHGMSIQDAVNAPRIFSSSYPNVQWESGLSQAVRDELTRRGDTFQAAPSVIGSAQTLIIDRQTGRMYGAGDPRRNGTAISVAEAKDGQNLWGQSPAVQASFMAAWGSMAPDRWAYEHDQQMGR